MCGGCIVFYAAFGPFYDLRVLTTLLGKIANSLKVMVLVPLVEKILVIKVTVFDLTLAKSYEKTKCFFFLRKI